MFRTICFISVILTLLGGCSRVLGLPNLSRMQQQSRLMQQLMKQPDLPHWYEQRPRVAQALGDRIFDKTFDEVFDAITVALGSMEVRVDNMEKGAGYIAATGTLLPPQLADKLRHESLVEYCHHHGYDPSLLDARGGFEIDPDMAGGMMARVGTSLTISVVRQSATQTKVKLRFKGIEYPRALEESYRAVWPGIDKQIFLDRHLD